MVEGYETIGISSVFASNRDGLLENQQLTGKIKTQPEDFKVFEIGLNGKTAVITDKYSIPSLPKKDTSSLTNNNTQIIENEKDGTPESKKSSSIHPNQQPDNQDDEEALIQFLRIHVKSLSLIRKNTCFEGNNSKVLKETNTEMQPEDAYPQLKCLHDLAIKSTHNIGMDDCVEFPVTKMHIRICSSKCESDEQRKSENKILRGKFHKLLKSVFPLLKSSNQGNNGVNESDMIILVEIEKKFYDLVEYLKDPVESLKKINWFYHKRHTIFENNPDMEINLSLLSTVSKEGRRKIHKAISIGCRDFDTSTRKADDCISIIIKLSKRMTSGKRKRQGKSSSSEPYMLTSCVVKKSKVEHLSCINALSNVLHIKSSDIGLAGIKDTFAVTNQFATFRGVPLKKLQEANEKLLHYGIELGNFNYASRSDFLTTGQLQGNKFDLYLKEIRVLTSHEGNRSVSPCRESIIKSNLNRIRKYGMVNFYGEQRLGAIDEEGVRSFDIGRALLQGKYEEAVDLVMKGRLKSQGKFIENEQVRKFRLLWKESNRNIDTMLKALPRNAGLNREKLLLQGLKRHGISDCYNAFCSLPHSIRSFWVNAYQSYVWNYCASRRLEQFGSNVVPGDLYRDKDGSIKLITNEIPVVDVTIEQVVLPLPGHKIDYPKNTIGNLFIEILEKDGINFIPSTKCSFQKHAKGNYRHLVVSVKDLSFDALNKSSINDEDFLESIRLQFQVL